MRSLAGCLGAGLQQLEPTELLALLANLGAQQQAVLAAIAEKQQAMQQALQQAAVSGRVFQPAGCHTGVAGGTSSACGAAAVTADASGEAARRPAVDVRVAAGDAATAVLQQKPWRV